MAKRPDSKTLEDGAFNIDEINYNFQSIAEKFDTLLQRDNIGVPNYMEENLDVADATLTNITQLEVNQVFLSGTELIGALLSDDNVVLTLADITDFATGSIIYYRFGALRNRLIGNNGEMLKAIDGQPLWQADNDADTVGVTVQENGTTIAENVTIINYVNTQSSNFVNDNGGGIGGGGGADGGNQGGVDVDAWFACLIEDANVPQIVGIGFSESPVNYSTVDLASYFSQATIENGLTPSMTLTVSLDYTASNSPFECESYIGVRFRNYAGGTLSSPSSFFDPNPHTAENFHEATFTVPSTARYIDTNHNVTKSPLVTSVTVNERVRKVCFN